MAISCDPKVLQNAAACFSECIPPGMEKTVQNYLLAQILAQLSPGTSTDPKVILQAAAPFMTHFGFEDAVALYLLCQIAQASGA